MDKYFQNKASTSLALYSIKVIKVIKGSFSNTLNTVTQLRVSQMNRPVIHD